MTVNLDQKFPPNSSSLKTSSGKIIPNFYLSCANENRLRSYHLELAAVIPLCAFPCMEIAKVCFSFLDQQSYLFHMTMFHFLYQSVHPTSRMFRHDSTCKHFLQLPERFSFLEHKVFHPVRQIFPFINNL